MKEKLQEYALIAEIISAIAVVAGLIFVGLQIRQGTEETALNTRAVEVAAYQDLIGQIMEINVVSMSNPQLMEIVVRREDGEILQPFENRMFANYLASLFRHADLACYQYQQGLISEDRLGSALKIFYDLVYQTGFIKVDFMQGTMDSSPGFSECLDLVVNRFSGQGDSGPSNL